jgi:DivIVA domain-containing protein
MWFFATCVVLVMGGVALVAAGRGQPMSEAYDDRPDALVPAAGPLGGEHLRRVRFSLAFRGYRMSEVDGLLDRLARQLEEAAEEPAPGPAGETLEPVEGPGEEPVEEPGDAAAPEPLLVADAAGDPQTVEPPADREARGDDHTA